MQNLSEITYVSESQELRSNTWTFCIYPDDSLPDNYLEIINSLSWGVPTLLSPVHDSDVNGNGMEKKKHIHVMLYFGKGANKSYTQVMKFVSKLNGCPCEVVHNSVGMIRYFVHRDNPEKAQYKIEDIKGFWGFQYLEAFENLATDENEYFSFLEDYCEDNMIYNYYQLTFSLKKNKLINELNFLRRHSTHIRFLLTDKYQILKRLDKLNNEEKLFTEVESN